MSDRGGSDDDRERRERSGTDSSDPEDGSDDPRPTDPDRGDPDAGRGEAGPGPRDDVDPDAERQHDVGEPADRTGAGRGGTESNRQGGPRAGQPDDSSRIATEERRRNAPIVTGVVAVVGLWVALSGPLLEGAADAALWNNVLVGAAILLAAGYNYFRLSNDVPLSVGVASLVALLGVWLVIAAPLLEMDGGAFWSTIASGLLAAGLAGYDAYEGREARTVTTEEGAESGVR